MNFHDRPEMPKNATIIALLLTFELIKKQSVLIEVTFYLAGDHHKKNYFELSNCIF